MNLSRRSFGRTTLAGAAALAGATVSARPLPAADEQKPTGWIDAHVHIWTPDTTNYPLSPNFKQADMQPPSFTADELFGHCRPAGVGRIVLIQMSFYEYDHKFMLEAMKAHEGVFSGVALIDYQADDVTDRMESLASQGVRGFRLHSRGTAKDWVNDRGMEKLWRKAADAGWAVCPLINPTDLVYVDALCKKFPDTTVVVDHFARIGINGAVDSEQLDMLCRLARFSNTHVKTSAFYALGKKTAPYEDLIPMIQKVVDSFGPDRLMWASDCPFQVQGNHDYQSSIALIRDRIDFLSASDKQWMLRDTADKVFFS
jgi:predicted TIM-barrel fold metal-dependent hydrolase